MGADRQRTYLADEAATLAFGATVAASLLRLPHRDLLILLQGDLGAGKTTFGRGLLRELGHKGPVPSPTYTLLEPYHFDEIDVCHLDLYRLADAAELEYIGWRDLATTTRLVEWPERCPGLTDEADLRILLTLAGEGRQAEWQVLSEKGAALDAVLQDFASA